jgi:hypothetical protein
MSITLAFRADTQTISTTEFSLTSSSTSLGSISDGGVFALVLDLAAMAAGDQYIFRVYDMAVSGGTQRLKGEWTFTGAQADPIAEIGGITLANGWEMTGEKLAGTDRSIVWRIVRVS